MSDTTDHTGSETSHDGSDGPDSREASEGREGRDQAGATGTVSEAGSSFSDVETSEGGADAVPGTPDGVPPRNRDENEVVDDDLLA